MTTAVVAPPKQDSFNELAALLQRARKQIGLAVPKHLTPDRLIRVALTAWQRTPALQECTAMSILGALMQAGQLGLEPDNVLGHAYLVPFRNSKTGKKEAQFIIGYKGLLELTGRSERLAGLPQAQCVYSGDTFTFEYGINQQLRHVPCGEDDPAKITHAWAMAHYTDGSPVFTVMQRSKIDKIRAGSKAGESGPWVTHYEEMARKTVLRRLCKTLPVAVELQRHLATEEMIEAGVLDPSTAQIGVIPLSEQTEQAPPKTKAEQAAEKIANRRKQQDPGAHAQLLAELRLQIEEVVNDHDFTPDEITAAMSKAGVESQETMSADQAKSLLEILVEETRKEE